MEEISLDSLMTQAEKCACDEVSLVKIIDYLEDILEKQPCSEVRYACAYAWYLHPKRSKRNDISNRVDELLMAVLQDLPQDYLSLLYMGHNSYDQGDYNKSIEYFVRAKASAEKNYIGLKAFEMILCCRIHLKEVDNVLEALEDFVEEASADSYEPEDVWPRELAKAFEKNFPYLQLTLMQKNELVRLCHRIDDIGSLNGWISGIVSLGCI